MFEFFETLYQNFNDRKIDLVIAHMTPDVKWANGMEGGFVHGHEQVRAYWTRQFAMVSSHVTPLDITQRGDICYLRVKQVVKDLNDHLLDDRIVTHVFKLTNSKIAIFEIQ